MTHELIAYEMGDAEGWTLEPASPRREWMAQTPYQGANRCLPLVIANQAGWILRCPVKFKVTWNGKKMLDSLQFEFPEEQKQARGQVLSLFGYGIISFRIPWLFRTSEGFGLFVRGPTNYYKENVVPLDGLVETDWAPYTFTMNWKIVKPNSPIWFKKGEAVCMIIPYPIAVIEQFKTHTAQIDDEPELLDAYRQWSEQRTKQYEQIARQDKPEDFYRLDYVRGSRPDGTFAKAHWSKLKLARFDASQEPA